jgi:undecaprenyl diphosphate synthase
MAYSGVDEMTEAIKKITESKLQNPNLIIDGALVKNYLWTKDLPAVDFVIRTGGEPHWSQGIMMWDVAEAQLYFTETLWPDFGSEEFKEALRDYENRERKFGA